MSYGAQSTLGIKIQIGAVKVLSNHVIMIQRAQARGHVRLCPMAVFKWVQQNSISIAKAIQYPNRLRSVMCHNLSFSFN